MPAHGITINGQLIPWGFVFKVRSMCGGDWDQCMDAFWKARDKKGPWAVQRYIMAGFTKNKITGVQYSLLPSKERENGHMESIRKWWNGLYEKKKPVMSMKDIFAGIAAGTEKQ